MVQMSQGRILSKLVNSKKIEKRVILLPKSVIGVLQLMTAEKNLSLPFEVFDSKNKALDWFNTYKLRERGRREPRSYHSRQRALLRWVR